MRVVALVAAGGGVLCEADATEAAVETPAGTTWAVMGRECCAIWTGTGRMV
jgi:hypothetical protein